MNTLCSPFAASIHRLRTRGASFLLTVLITIFCANASAHAQDIAGVKAKAGDAILIMDYSNSMWGQINGVPKVEIARDVLNRNFRSWNQLTNLGLLSYGHRYKNDCADIQLISPPGELDTSIVDRFLQQAKPKGRTPLTSAIERAASFFIATGEEANIILLTDGIESCDRDPCETIQALQQAGVSLTAHVIGFGVSENEGSQLSCIASLTGGEYLNASNADTLDFAFREAIELIQLNDEITALEHHNSKLRHTINSSQDEIIRLAGENSSLSARSQDLQASKSELEARADRLQTALRDTEVRHGQLQVVNQKLQDQNSDMLVQNGDLRSEILRLEGVLDRNEDNLRETQADLQFTHGKLTSTENTLLRTEDDLRRAQNELSVRQEDLMATRVLLGETQEERERLWMLTTEMRSELDALRDELAASRFANERLHQRNEDLAAQGADLRQALQNMMDAISAGNEALKSAFSIGSTISSDVNDRVSMSEMTVDGNDASLRSATTPGVGALETGDASPSDSTPLAALVADIAEGSRVHGHDRVEITLANGVAPALPDVEWTVSKLDQSGNATNTITGNGNGFVLPDQAGLYDIAVTMKPFIKRFQVEVDDRQPQVHGVNFTLGRIEVEDARLRLDETVLRFEHENGNIIEHLMTGDDVLYLPYGDYLFTTSDAQDSRSTPFSVSAGDAQALSVQSL